MHMQTHTRYTDTQGCSYKYRCMHVNVHAHAHGERRREGGRERHIDTCFLRHTDTYTHISRHTDLDIYINAKTHLYLDTQTCAHINADTWHICMLTLPGASTFQFIIFIFTYILAGEFQSHVNKVSCQNQGLMTQGWNHFNSAYTAPRPSPSSVQRPQLRDWV